MEDVISFFDISLEHTDIEKVVDNYYTLNKFRKKIEEIENKYKEYIFNFLGESLTKSTTNFYIKVIFVSGKPDIIITEDMVGQKIPGRKPSKRLHVEKK